MSETHIYHKKRDCFETVALKNYYIKMIQMIYFLILEFKNTRISFVMLSDLSA